jgi:hypothetical protein
VTIPEVYTHAIKEYVKSLSAHGVGISLISKKDIDELGKLI